MLTKRRMVWSAPAVTIQGYMSIPSIDRTCVGWKSVSSTPRSSVTVCPRNTFSGTISALWMKSLYTVSWNTCTVPSSEQVLIRG